MRKKLFAVIMSAMMMITFMPSMAFAAYSEGKYTISDIKWSEDFTSATGDVYFTESSVTSKSYDDAAATVTSVWNNDGKITATLSFPGLGDQTMVEYAIPADQTRDYFNLTGATLVDNSGNVLTTIEADKFASLKNGNSVDGFTFNYSGLASPMTKLKLVVPSYVKDYATKAAAVATTPVYASCNALKVGTKKAVINYAYPEYTAYDEGSYTLKAAAPVATTADATTEVACVGTPADITVQVAATFGQTHLTAVANNFTVDGKTNFTGEVSYNGENHVLANTTKGVKVEYAASKNAKGENITDAKDLVWSETAPEMKNVDTYKVYWRASLVRDNKIKTTKGFATSGTITNSTHEELNLSVNAVGAVVKFEKTKYVFGEGVALKPSDFVVSAGFAKADEAYAKKFVEKYVLVSGIIDSVGENQVSLAWNTSLLNQDKAETITGTSYLTDEAKTLVQFLKNYGYELSPKKLVLATADATLVIQEAKANKVTVSTKTINAKAKKTISKKISASAKSGTLTFKKVSGNKKITVASNGKVTVKKGLKKGKTYSLKVKASVAANGLYGKASKTATIKVKVK